jgi:hypothetical protein
MHLSFSVIAVKWLAVAGLYKPYCISSYSNLQRTTNKMSQRQIKTTRKPVLHVPVPASVFGVRQAGWRGDID